MKQQLRYLPSMSPKENDHQYKGEEENTANSNTNNNPGEC